MDKKNFKTNIYLMMICTRKLEFDSAHRVMEHESKCKMLHGHRYVVEASFAAKELDEIGRIIDFGLIREILGKWIDDNLDHNAILWLKILQQRIFQNIYLKISVHNFLRITP